MKRALKESKERHLKKTIEREQIKGENRLKDAQTIAHLGSWEIDMVSNTQTWSDELFNIFGIKRGDVLPSTESYLKFIHPDDMDFVNGKVKTAFSKIADSSYDFRFIRQDGAPATWLREVTFEFDREHNPLRRYGIIQDVTEKKLAEEALLKSEANLRAIFDNTDTAFIPD